MPFLLPNQQCQSTEGKFGEHIKEKINKAYSILGVIKRNFIHIDKNTFVLLYKAMVRPRLEYANSAWCPFKKGDIERESYKVNYILK